MLSILKLLSFLLPLTTPSNTAPFQSHSWNTTNSTLLILAENTNRPSNDYNHRPGWPGGNRGDTLGVTRCYCASQNWKRDDRFGYYYLWDYYNVHSGSRVKLERSCSQTGRTRIGWYGSLNYQIKCLRPRWNEKDCMKDVAGNKFCYHYTGKEKFDFFSWNGQKRGIPLKSKVAVHASEEEVNEKCESLCREKVSYQGEMEMLKGLSLRYAEVETPDQDRFHSGSGVWGIYSDNEWSHIAYYPEVDDMCHGCK